MSTPSNAYALGLTCAICGVLECLWLAVFWAREGSLLGGLFYSLLVFGPLFAWIGPPLYRYICRATA